MAGANSAHDFSTEHAPVPLGTCFHPGGGLIGAICPKAAGVSGSKNMAIATKLVEHPHDVGPFPESLFVGFLGSQ